MAKYNGKEINLNLNELELTGGELANLIELFVKAKLSVAPESDLTFDDVGALIVDGHYLPMMINNSPLVQYVCTEGAAVFRAAALLRYSEFERKTRHRE